MASHEWRTEECEQFVRLYWNHVFIIQRAKTTRTKIRVYSDWMRRRQFDGVIHDALVFYVNQSENSHRALYNSNAVDLTWANGGMF